MDGVKDVIAGTVGGFAICLVGHPLDTLKVRLQTQPSINPLYSGLVDCLTKTIKWEGLGGLYKGVASPLFGQMFFNSVQFLAYGQAKALYQTDTKKNLTITEYFMAGAITGLAVSFVESPIDFIKSQIQTQIFAEKSSTGSSSVKYKGVADCAKQIYTQRGVLGLFQGLVPTILRDIPAVSCYFGFYELSRQHFAKQYQGDVSKLTATQLLISGGVGGILYWSFTYPIDVIKTSIQGDSTQKSERKFKGVIDCGQKLYAEGGIPRFFRGFSPCMLRAFPANAACFFAYEKTRQILG